MMNLGRWRILALMLLASCSQADYGVREPTPADMVPVEPREPGPPETRAQIKQIEPKPAVVVEWELGLARGTLEAQMAADYLAYSGDTLSILFQSHPKLSQDAVVTPDGSLVVNQVGTFPVRAKTLTDIQTLLSDSATKS